MKMLVKNFCFFAFTAFAVLSTSNGYAASAVAQQIQGEVLVQKAGAAPESWTAVTTDTPLATGDSLRTKEGNCSLVYSDQATFSVEKNTTLTVAEKPETNDISLLLGKIRGKVNHDKADHPFVVTTPAAVATVRGTEVDFSFNEEGQLLVDLHNGKIQVVNDDAELKVDLEGKKSITIKYDKESGLLRVKNECGSDGVVTFNMLGNEYAENPCEEKEVSLSTAEQGTNTPETNNGTPDNPENPDEGREPISPTT